MNLQTLIYSKSAAARILGVSSNQIEELQVWHKTVWLKVTGDRPLLISKTTFKQHFADWRKANSQGLVVTKHILSQNTYTVRNEVKDTRYQVVCRTNELTCTCDDWQNQKELIGRACCKHCYAVLNQLGYSSLADYLSVKAA